MDSNTMTPDQVHGFVALMVSLWIFIAIFAIGIRALTVWFFWRIFARAGFNGAIALVNIVPLGTIVSVLILAFAEWPAAGGSTRAAPATG
jgi:hypothetical protein